IPAGLEDSQSGARLKRMLSGDHTIHAHYDRAPGPSFRPLLLLRDQSCSREEQGTSKENEIPFVRCHSYRSPWAPSSACAVMRCKFPLTNCTSASAPGPSSRHWKTSGGTFSCGWLGATCCCAPTGFLRRM